MRSLFHGLSWLVGVAMACACLGAFSTSAPLSIAYGLMSAVMLPPVRSCVYSITHKTLSGGQRLFVVLALMVIAGGLTDRKLINARDKTVAAAAMASSSAIPTAKIDNEMQTKALLSQLKSIPSSDVKTLSRVYQSLSALNPQSTAYADKAKSYTEQAQALEQRQTLSTAWSYEDSPDELTQTKYRFATVRSNNTFDFKFPYAGAQRGTLQLRVHPRYGQDVILSISRGQFLCGIEDCTLSVRFDEGQVQRFTAVSPEDHSTTILFIRNYARFLGELRHSKVVRIEANFFQEGARVLEFDVAGLQWT